MRSLGENLLFGDALADAVVEVVGAIEDVLKVQPEALEIRFKSGNPGLR